MKLIIVNGKPATGKTTLSRRLAKESGYKVIAKDDIKEFLFDYIGSEDRDWSMKIGAAVSDFMHMLADVSLGCGKSIILESAFYAKFARPQIEKVKEKYDLEVIEIYCDAPNEIIHSRFAERDRSGNRHAGHVDGSYDLDLNEEKYRAIGVGKLVKVDTTNFGSIDYDYLINLIVN